MNDVGLTVDFDGKVNQVFANGEVTSYPIGEMMCEYARLVPSDLKQLLLECPHQSEPMDSDLYADTMMWLYVASCKAFGIIAGHMIATEFSSVVRDLRNCSEDERKEMLQDMNKSEGKSSIKDFILEDTGYTEFGCETVAQLLLSAYMVFASIYASFRHSFNIVVSEAEVEEKHALALWSFYSDNHDFQHFTFRILNVEGEFRSVYTIQSSMSLALFEIAHSMDANTIFVKCKNCGNYFVPARRSDAKYCDYPSPQQKTKTCKEIGAQIARANKEKNDAATKQYRKLYMQMKMASRRNPQQAELRERLHRLTSEAKAWRKEMMDGTKDTKEFLAWLESFPNSTESKTTLV